MDADGFHKREAVELPAAFALVGENELRSECRVRIPAKADSDSD
jgi:hypothetical protein